MALSNSLVFGPDTFVRVPSGNLLDGKFLNQASSVNTPHYILVRPKVVMDNVSTFIIQNTISKDPVVSTAGAKDDILSVQISIRCDLRRFTNAEIKAALTNLYTPMGTDAFIGQILRGES